MPGFVRPYPGTKKEKKEDPREPGIYQETPESFWHKLSDFTREDPKVLKAKAQNALQYSEMLGIKPSEAYRYHDEISSRIFSEKLTTPKLVGGLMVLPVAAALASNPLGAILGMGAIQAVSEAESAAISFIKNKKYQAFRNRGLADLLPEDSSELTKSTVDLFDMLGKMVVGGAAFKGVPKLGTKIARDIIVEHKLPKELYIDGVKLKQELQTGGILPEKELQIYKDLGLQGSEVKQAIKRGLKIKVPSEKIITITDKPWWGKVKQLLRISPYKETRTLGGEKPSYEFGQKGEKVSSLAEKKTQIVEKKLKQGFFGGKTPAELEQGVREQFNAVQKKSATLPGDIDEKRITDVIEATMTNEKRLTGNKLLVKLEPGQLDSPQYEVAIKKISDPDKYLSSGEKQSDVNIQMMAGDFYEVWPDFAEKLSGDYILEVNPDTGKVAILPPEGSSAPGYSVEFTSVDERGIPELTSTEEAISFGEKATPEQLNQLAEKYIEARDQAASLREQAKKEKNPELMDEAGSWGFKAQFAREAIEAKIGQGKVNQRGKTPEEVLGGKGKADESVKEISGLDTFPKRKQKVLKKILDVTPPEVRAKVKSLTYKKMSDRHGETIGSSIVLSTADAMTLGHEIGELLQPAPKLGRGKTIEGEEARKRDELSDAVAYVLMKDAGLKPKEKITPELEQKARELLSGKQKKVDKLEPPELSPAGIDEIKAEAIKEVKSPKTRIRIISGQVKISDLVREDTALKASLRKAAREARHAMSVGKKEGYEEAKKHYLEIREKVKKREAEKAYVSKLIKNITKPLGDTIDIGYKEAIEVLREGIDFHFRSKKTIESKERMREFFSRNPDKLVDMPVKFIREMSKKPLNEYTIEDLEKISKEVDRLRKLGRTKRRLKLNKQKRELENKKDDILISLGGTSDGERPPLVKSTKQKSGAVELSRALTLRPSRIFDKLDRGKEFSGPIHKIFYEEVNKAVDQAYKHVDSRLGASKEAMKELGISFRDLAKVKEIEGIKLTVDEMLDIYAGWENPRKRLALEFGNNITPEFAEKVIESLSPEEKKFADWIISEYGKNYPRMRESYAEYANDDLGWEPYYTPIRRMDLLPNSFRGELADELLVRRALKKGYVGRSFTYQRKDIPADLQRPIMLGLFNTWLDQVPKQERFNFLGLKVKELQRLASDREIRNTIRENFGSAYLDAVDKYVNRVANPNIYKAFSSLERVSQTLRKNMVIAYLSYNLVTMGKQLPSVMLYLPEAGPAHLISAGLKFTSNPKRWIRFVNERDPQVKHRMIERELEEMKNIKNIHARLGKFGTKGIQLFDKLAVTIGWLAVYDKNVAKLGEQEAIRLAQNATLRTQPAAHAKDLPQLYTTNEFLNWMTQFTNQLNQIYNIVTYDIPQQVKNKRMYKAFLSTLSLAIVSLVIWSMSNRRLPEDDEDVKEALKDQAFNMIPLFGRYMLAASEGWSGSSNSVIKSAESVGGLISNSSREKKVKAIVEALAVTTGTPYTGMKRAAEAVMKGDVKELLGPKKSKNKGRRNRYKK